MADKSIAGSRVLAVPMNELYETDLLLWSERQAELLRRVAAGKRVNDEVDWENVVEEIESVGRNELREVESLLVQAIAHTLKAEAWPLSRDVALWYAEARRFRGDAAARFTPAMRQRLDMTQIWRRALRAVPETIDGQGPLTHVPTTCPVTLDELLSEE
jgi:Domain of unknown function DUF29